MSSDKLNNFLHGILIVLTSSYIIGSIIFYTQMNGFQKDYEINKIVNKQNIEILNNNIKDVNKNISNKNKAVNYRIDRLHDKLNKVEKNLDNLQYIILKNNKELKKQLEELKYYSQIYKNKHQNDIAEK